MLSAQSIVEKANIDSYAGMAVFLSTIEVLTNK